MPFPKNQFHVFFLTFRYRPDLIDFHTLDAKESVDNLQLAFDLLDHELGISPVIKATELADITKVPDKLTMMSYLSQVYDCFRREIPNVQHSMEGKDISQCGKMKDLHSP